MAVVKNAQGINSSQVLILQALIRAGVNGVETSVLQKTAGVPVNSGSIGPAFTEVLDNYPDSLRARGLVYCEKMEGERVRWYITKKGIEVATEFKGRKIGPKRKVPKQLLDPIVMEFKKTRAYGLEYYTEDDLCAIREELGPGYEDMDYRPQGDLHSQILARRKQGAFGDKEEKRRKQLEKLYREFGPNGTVIEGFLDEDQIMRLQGLLGGSIADGDDE